MGDGSVLTIFQCPTGGYKFRVVIKPKRVGDDIFHLLVYVWHYRVRMFSFSVMAANRGKSVRRK